MPEGMKGFQPGRPKTGGRVKGSVAAARKSSKFADQLKGYGFNYPKELAEVLLDIKRSSNDPGKLSELKFLYTELKALLPYMAPKLREKEVITADESNEEEKASTQNISTDDILKAINGPATETRPDKSASNTHFVGTGSPGLYVPGRSEEDIQDMAREQIED